MVERASGAQGPKYHPHNFEQTQPKSSTPLSANPFADLKRLDEATLKNRDVQEREQPDSKPNDAFKRFAPRHLPPTRNAA